LAGTVGDFGVFSGNVKFFEKKEEKKKKKNPPEEEKGNTITPPRSPQRENDHESIQIERGI
jgi:hypothetical protein